MSEQTEEQLLQKIAQLEQQYEVAHQARLEAERKLAGHTEGTLSHTSSHQALANQKAFGIHPDVEYVEKQRKGQRSVRRCQDECKNSLINRMCLGYNMAAFIKRPVIHQYLQGGKLYREAEELQSSKFELFFDLVFVGFVHQLSDAAAESPSGLGLVKYILTFAPAFSVWSDVRDVMNIMGTDDVSQRLFILWIMALLVGYSTNAGVIELAILSSPLEEGAPPEEVQKLATSQLAVQYTMGFFCVAKFSRVALYWVYSYFLPDARVSMFASSLNSAFPAVLFFIAIFLVSKSFTAVYALVILAILAEYFLRLSGILFIKLGEIRKRKEDAINGKNREENESEKADQSPTPPDFTEAIVIDSQEDVQRRQRIGWRWDRKTPAYNIEHHVERLGAFVTIVLGEMVASVFFQTTFATGINREYGKAVLGLMIAFNLNWMYFDSGGAANYIHAIRRHWFTGFWFSVLHSPLCAALLLTSGALNRFVTSDSDIEQGIRWFLGVGVGLSILIMATIGVLHKVLEVPHKVFHARRRFILFTRYVAGITMILLPLARDKLGAVEYLGVYAGITAFLIIEEMVLRLEKAEDF